jgi:hypothetical protein
MTSGQAKTQCLHEKYRSNKQTVNLNISDQFLNAVHTATQPICTRKYLINWQLSANWPIFILASGRWLLTLGFALPDVT